jgi:hypothetical protein
VAVAAIRDVDPSIAVVLAALPQAKEGHEVWLGPGYMAQSPLHPLQDEIHAAESWKPTTYSEQQWHCQAPHLLRVRARERPAATSGQIRNCELQLGTDVGGRSPSARATRRGTLGFTLAQ